MTKLYDVVSSDIELCEKHKKWLKFSGNIEEDKNVISVIAEGGIFNFSCGVILYPSGDNVKFKTDDLAENKKSSDFRTILDGLIIGIKQLKNYHDYDIHIFIRHLGIPAIVNRAWSSRDSELSTKFSVLRKLLGTFNNVRFIHYSDCNGNSTIHEWIRYVKEQCEYVKLDPPLKFNKFSMHSKYRKCIDGKVITLCKCRCDCGIEKEMQEIDVRLGIIKSCGCLQKYDKHFKLEIGEAYLNSLISTYKRNHNKKFKFRLSRDEFKDLICKRCHYCGADPKSPNSRISNGKFNHNGIDRKDSTRDYILENCVPCCKICNRLKSNYAISEFIDRAYRISKCDTDFRYKDKVLIEIPKEYIYFTSRLMNALKGSSKFRKISLALDNKQLYNIVINACTYCGIVPHTSKALKIGKTPRGIVFKHHGLDRLDHTKGYSLENCISCCKLCNYGKQVLLPDIFIQHAKRIVSYQSRSDENFND